MNEQQHHIGLFSLDLVYQAGNCDFNEVQEQLTGLNTGKMIRSLEPVLSGASVPDEVFIIPKMEIDIRINGDQILEAELNGLLPFLVEKELKKLHFNSSTVPSSDFRSSSGPDMPVVTDMLSDADQGDKTPTQFAFTEYIFNSWIFFLRQGFLPGMAGSMPVWADVESAVLEYAQKNKKKVVECLQELARGYFSVKRMTKQSSQGFLLRLLLELQNFYPVRMDMGSGHLVPWARKPSSVDLIKILMGEFMDVPSSTGDKSGSKSRMDEKPISSEWQDEERDAKNTVSVSSGKVKNGDHQDSPHLGLARQFDPDAKGYKKQKEGSMEALNEAGNDLKRLNNKVQQSGLRDHDLIPETRVPESLFTRQAGLILLHPYLHSLFTETECIVDKNFISNASCEKAVQILHYLATGRIGAPEYELIMEKTLCGMPIQQPISKKSRLLEKDRIEADHLLNIFIGHWSRLGNTSIAALRETFLQREGMIRFKESFIEVLVEAKSVDILLHALPFGISYISLPWLNQTIQTEWNYHNL